MAPSCEEQDSRTLAERIRNSIGSNPVQTPDGVLQVTCSLGAATMRRGRGEKADALIARADAALYRAKASGRNRTELDKT